MDLQNKQIIINRLSIDNLQNLTVVTIDVYKTINNDLRVLENTFELRIEDTFQGMSDPALMAEIVNRLTQV